jgi:hypothetical protein
MSWSGPTQLGSLTSGSTAAFTVPTGGVPVGALLLIRLVDGATTGTYGASDNATGSTNTYTALTPIVDSAIGYQATMIYCLLTTALAAGNRIQLTRGGSTGFGPCAQFTYFTGGTGTTDGSNATDTGYSSTWTTGSITTTANGDLVVCGCGHNVSTGDSSASGGFTDEVYTYSSGISYGVQCQYQIQASAGAVTGGGTWTANGHGAAQILAFKAGGAAGASIPNLIMAPMVAS